MKVLVRLQNRYLPEFDRPDADAVRRRAGEDPGRPVAGSRQLLRRASCGFRAWPLSAAQLSQVYWFLVGGIDREPCDGWSCCARRPVQHKSTCRASPRGQDLFDAAQFLWLFLGPGQQLHGRNRLWRMDGRRESETDRLLRPRPGRPDHARAAPRRAGIGLYPHAVHLVGEGEGRRTSVTGSRRACSARSSRKDEDRVHRPGRQRVSQPPAHNGGRLPRHRPAHRRHRRQRGQMAQYVKTSSRSGQLPEGDILNFTRGTRGLQLPGGRSQGPHDLAANPADGRPQSDFAAGRRRARSARGTIP